jgi:AraC-like DNA-binding protein
MQYERPAVEYLEPLTTFIYRSVPKLPDIPDNIDRRLLKITNYFDSEQGRERRDLEKLCRELSIGISGDRVARLFHQSIGIAFKNYIATKRFLHSLADVENTEDSLKEIAARAGYQTAAALTRTFKKTLLVSPKEYRNIVRFGKTSFTNHYLPSQDKKYRVGKSNHC